MTETVQVLSERAKLRLRLAAGLLRANGVNLDCPRDQFYAEIQKILASLPDDERASLKASVDWLEAYDRTSAALDSAVNPPARPLKYPPAARRSPHKPG